MLPKGQSAPQKVALGLYAELWTGTPSPRRARRTGGAGSIASTRRPSTSRFANCRCGLLRSGPFDEVPTPPTHLRWDPLPLPEAPTDFIDGLMTLGGNGDPHAQSGIALHVYAANASMTGPLLLRRGRRAADRAAARRDSRVHRARLLDVRPGHICVVPRGMRFRVELPGRTGARAGCRELRSRLPSARARSDRIERPRQCARLRLAGGCLRASDGTFRQDAKFLGRLWTAEIDHSPLDVVAWHGNYAPYRLRPRELRRAEHGDVRPARPVHLHGADGADGNSRALPTPTSSSSRRAGSWPSTRSGRRPSTATCRASS